MPTNVIENEQSSKVQDVAKMSTMQLCGIDPSALSAEQQADFYKTCHERLKGVVETVFFDKRNNALYIDGKMVGVLSRPMEFGKARVVPTEWTPRADRNGELKAEDMGLIVNNKLDLPEKRIDAGYTTLMTRFAAMFKLVVAGLPNTGVHIMGQSGKSKTDLANAAGMVASRIG